MSEKPFSRHERLRGTELEDLKRSLSQLLIDFTVNNADLFPYQFGTGFKIVAEKVTAAGFKAALQNIAIQYDDNIIFNVSNVDQLIIEVTDISDEAAPTLN